MVFTFEGSLCAYLRLTSQLVGPIEPRKPARAAIQPKRPPHPHPIQSQAIPSHPHPHPSWLPRPLSAARAKLLRMRSLRSIYRGDGVAPHPPTPLWRQPLCKRGIMSRAVTFILNLIYIFLPACAPLFALLLLVFWPLFLVFISAFWPDCSSGSNWMAIVAAHRPRFRRCKLLLLAVVARRRWRLIQRLQQRLAWLLIDSRVVLARYNNFEEDFDRKEIKVKFNLYLRFVDIPFSSEIMISSKYHLQGIADSMPWVRSGSPPFLVVIAIRLAENERATHGCLNANVCKEPLNLHRRAKAKNGCRFLRLDLCLFCPNNAHE